MMQVFWSHSARRDLADIDRYIRRDSAMYASSMVRKITDATRQLADFPRMGRMIPEIGMTDRRELIVGPYRVMYAIDDQAVIITGVIHGARDWHPEGE